MLWDLNEGKHLYSLEAGDIVNALVFSPNRYWLCAATATCIKIFDLESKCVPTLVFSLYAFLTLILQVHRRRAQARLRAERRFSGTRVCLARLVSRWPDPVRWFHR